MKKLALALAVSVVASAVLTGCGSKGIEVDVEKLPTYEELSTREYDDDAYVKNLKLDKLVTLGEYKNLEVSVQKVSVDDAEVEKYIDRQLTNHPNRVEITDRAVEDGDTVNIDYIGLWQGGIEFDGGTAQDQDLVIGSDSFIDGFEDGIIGMKPGEVKHLELTFPEEYHSEEMAGQDVVFVVTLNQIFVEEEAELNDEWVKTLEIEEVSTVDDYRDYVYNMYLESDQDRYENEIRSALLKQAVENCEFQGDYTSAWQRYFDLALMNIQYQTSYYGFDLETFAMLSGNESLETFVNELIITSEDGVKESLLANAIAKAEGIEVTEEDINEELELMAEMYGFESVEAYTAVAGDARENEDFMELMLTDKVLDFMAESAVIIETEPVDQTQEAAE